MDNTENPYTSPAEPIDGGPFLADMDGATGPAKPYASARTRARWAIFFLAVILVGNIVSAVSTGFQIELLQRMEVGDFSAEEAPQNDIRQRSINFVLVIANLSAMVSFLMWFHRAHRNLPSLGTANLQFSPAWAVGFWFIPFLNLYEPFQVMKEIWRGSDPATTPNIEKSPRRPAGLALIVWWWALFLIMLFLGNLVGYMASMASDAKLISRLIDLSWLSIAKNVIALFAALLAILVVRRVTANQEERFRLLGESGQHR